MMAQALRAYRQHTEAEGGASPPPRVRMLVKRQRLHAGGVCASCSSASSAAAPSAPPPTASSLFPVTSSSFKPKPTATHGKTSPRSATPRTPRAVNTTKSQSRPKTAGPTGHVPKTNNKPKSIIIAKSSQPKLINVCKAPVIQKTVTTSMTKSRSHSPTKIINDSKNLLPSKTIPMIKRQVQSAKQRRLPRPKSPTLSPRQCGPTPPAPSPSPTHSPRDASVHVGIASIDISR